VLIAVQWSTALAIIQKRVQHELRLCKANRLPLTNIINASVTLGNPKAARQNDTINTTGTMIGSGGLGPIQMVARSSQMMIGKWYKKNLASCMGIELDKNSTLAATIGVDVPFCQLIVVTVFVTAICCCYCCYPWVVVLAAFAIVLWLSLIFAAGSGSNNSKYN